MILVGDFFFVLTASVFCFVALSLISWVAVPSVLLDVTDGLLMLGALVAALATAVPLKIIPLATMRLTRTFFT